MEAPGTRIRNSSKSNKTENKEPFCPKLPSDKLNIKTGIELSDSVHKSVKALSNFDQFPNGASLNEVNCISETIKLLGVLATYSVANICSQAV